MDTYEGFGRFPLYMKVSLSMEVSFNIKVSFDGIVFASP